MVTIKDIANKAKVAPSTVSNVLNNTKPVTDAVRERVFAAVKELGYRPNLVARSLKTKQTRTIGVVVPELTNAFFIEIVNAIEAHLYDHDYTILVCCTRENKQKEEKYLRNLLQRGIDGLVFVGTGLNPDLLLEGLFVPVVMVDRIIGDRFSSVAINNEQGGYMGARHLLEQGARKIVFLPGPLVLQTNLDRLQGYQRALTETGMTYDSSLVIQCADVTYQAGWDAVAGLDAQGAEYDAVFAASDFLAVGAMRRLLHTGRIIPEKVKVVGFDGIPTTEILTPSITTVNQPKEAMGKRAAEILLGLIENEGSQKVNMVFEPELIVRESSSGR